MVVHQVIAEVHRQVMEEAVPLVTAEEAHRQVIVEEVHRQVIAEEVRLQAAAEARHLDHIEGNNKYKYK